MKKVNKWRAAAITLMAGTIVTTVVCPPEYGTAGTHNKEITELYVRTVLQWTGRMSNSIWHGIWNFPQFTKMEFLDTRSGTIKWIWVGDKIRVRFSDGSKLLMINEGPLAAAHLWFKVIDGTERAAPTSSFLKTDGCVAGRTCRTDGPYRGYVTGIGTPVQYASFSWGTSSLGDFGTSGLNNRR